MPFTWPIGAAAELSAAAECIPGPWLPGRCHPCFGPAYTVQGGVHGHRWHCTSEDMHLL